MFEVFLDDTRGAPLWRRKESLALSAGLHALLLVGAAYAPVRSAVVAGVSPTREIVTFLEVLARQDAPDAPAADPGTPAAVQAGAARPARPRPTIWEAAGAGREPVELPDLAARVGIAASFQAPGADGPPELSTGPARTPGGGVEEAVDASLVSEQPVLQNKLEVEQVLKRLYPRRLNHRNIQGDAVVSFVIDTDGRVDPLSVRIVSTTHPGFAEATVEGAKRLRFRPARLGGRTVRVRAELPIRWRLEGYA